jgi:hypothetical protein
MSCLDWPIEDTPIGLDNDRRPRIAYRLVELFTRAFPQIRYSLVWSSRLVNAQAWRLGELRHVYLYGGLVRHPAIGKAGLALALAHETGHHLGGEPRDPDMRWMAWQGQADYWAAKTGMPAIFGEAAAQLTLRGALQIGKLELQCAQRSDEWATDLPWATRLEIFKAGLSGQSMPASAIEAYENLF